MLRALLAGWGGISFLLCVYLGYQVWRFDELHDPESKSVYWEFFKAVWQGDDPVLASSWRYPVQVGMTTDEVEETLKVVANEHNIKLVAELPLSEQITLMQGGAYRFVKIYLLCNPLTAARMLDFNEAFAANLPCRITLLADQQGKLWLYAQNMDLLIYGGKPLPEALKAEAIQVRDILRDVLKRAAAGDF